MSSRSRYSSRDSSSRNSESDPVSPTGFEESEAIANFKKKKDELEVFMERIKEIKYEREDVQKKTQTKWINSMLAKGGHPLVKDLFSDLRDGTRLLALLEVLTNQQFKREKGRMRVHHLNNVSRALTVLKDNNVRLVNISNNDIVDGSPKITLALTWSIFLHWQVNDIMKHLMATTHQSNLEKALLSWCQTNTEPYPGVDIKNFSTSWSDGLAFGALIHRWRPDIIDFATLVSKTDASERLDSVFKIAHEVLGIERLLDPDDVNTAIPDKKSVMMYVMCLFQSLAHSGIDPPPLPSTERLQEEIKQEVAKHEAELHKPPSVELTSYQNIVEEVLSWLLIADDRISSMEPISDDLNLVKAQFQEHEKFMLSLTEHQGGVGEVLQEGTRILQEGKIPPNEIEEVRVQMKLLNTKWEDLRVKAMDRQNKIHEKLMTLQLKELEALKEFLTSTEDRISHIGPPPLDNLDLLADHLHEQQQLHDDIVKEQERVVAFSNLVVVVDENNPENEFSNMEDQLSAISERWTHVCRWTEKRGKLLQSLQTQLPVLKSQQSVLEEWLKAQERKLKEVEANPNDTSEESLMDRYEKMQNLQSEMEEKLKEITELQTEVQKILDSDPQNEEETNSLSNTKFMNTLEGLQDRWEALSQIMEAQSQRMTKYGVKPKPKGTPKKTDVEMIDILAMSKQQDFPKAKRTKIMNEWENSFGRVNEWVQRTESLIEICPGSDTTTFDELSVDEQLILWEDLETELQSYEHVYKEAIKDSENLIEFMNQENQDTSEIEIQATTLKEKWTKVQDGLNSRKLLIDYLLAKKQLQSEISTMSNILNAYEKWLENQGEISPITNQPRKLLEQCRVKKKTIQSHESRIKKLRSKASEILTMDGAKSDTEFQQETQAFSKRWDHIVEKLNIRLCQLESINKMSAEEKSAESSHLISAWLSTVESTVLNEEIKLIDLKLMKAQQIKLAEFLQEAKSQEQSLEMIINSTKNNGDEDHSALEDLRSRFGDIKVILEERHSQLNSNISRLEQWQAEMSGLENWLEEVDVFVCAETPAVGEADVLEAQLEQSNALQEDIQTLTTKFNSLTSAGKNLLLDADDSILHSMKARIFKLTSHWNETVRKAHEQNIMLKDATDKTKVVLRGIDETVEWLNQLGRDAPKVPGKISSPSDLARLTRKYQALKDRVDKREESFRKLNEKGNELLLMHQTQCKDDAKRDSAVQDLAKTFTTLNSRWTDTTGLVDRNCQLLKDSSFLYGEFRSLTAQEMDWLDRLEKKLKKPVTAAADMEELSEDLDDIEQYVGTDQEARLSKLQEIGRKLVQDGILVNSIQADVQMVTNRWTNLNQQASQRKAELELEMAGAEEWETLVQQLDDSLECVDKILTNRLEQNDLEIEDLPNDTEQLSEELTQQERILVDMDAQVHVYRQAGKLEAAARLEEQKNMLHKRFTDVQSKFSTFTSPPPEAKIYARIERIWRSLRQVEQALCFLELASDDPESIQGQLNHCTKEYSKLSELKREVEIVLKEGRRHVEDKKAESKLNSELDSMKALYNKLGMQIAGIRSALEKGLAVSTQMNEQMESVELWLEHCESQLNGKFDDKEMEMDFLRGKTEELPRYTKIMEDFNSNFEHFLKLVDPVLLDSLKERRILILQKWELISHEIVRKHEENLKGVSVKDLESKENETIGELETWLEKAEDFLVKFTNEACMLSDEEILELQALNEDFTEKSDRLDGLKDTMIDLIVAKGDPYSVENPENSTMQKLTLRLESIGNQLQNLSSCILIDNEEDILSESLHSLSHASKNDNQKFYSTTNGNPDALIMKSSYPTQDSGIGICNPAFDFEDDENVDMEMEVDQANEEESEHTPIIASKIPKIEPEADLHISLPAPRKTPSPIRGYSIENVPEVSVTISRSVKSARESLEAPAIAKEPEIADDEQTLMDTENIETDEEADIEELSQSRSASDASTVVTQQQQQQASEKSPVVSKKSLDHLPEKLPSTGVSPSYNLNPPTGKSSLLWVPRASKRTAPTATKQQQQQKGNKERNIKIVEIKSNDIVQGILRMEPQPHVRKGEKLATVVPYCPVGMASEKRRCSGSRKLSKTVTSEQLVEDFSGSDSSSVVPDAYGFSSLSKAHTKPDIDLLAFEKEGNEISKTMSRMAQKLQEIEKDSDPRKRVDALEIELISVEPEVALTISKGDSLVFKISKVDVGRANQIRAALDLLRADWLQLKMRAERQRLAAMKLETSQLEVQRSIQQLEQWISSAILATDKESKKKLLSATPRKTEELQTIRKRIKDLHKRNIRGLSPELENLEKEWGKLEKSLEKQQKLVGTSKIPVPLSPPKKVSQQKEIEPMKSPPAVPPKKASVLSPELVTNVNKLREQVATISRILASSDDVVSIRQELDQLSPKLAKIEELECEVASGHLKGTPEQTAQASRVIQKLLDEWATVNISLEQMTLRSPASKSPSPSPVSSLTMPTRSPESSEIEDVENWLDEMDVLMKEWKINIEEDKSSDETKKKLKDMEAKVSKRHRSVMLLMSKKSRMSPAYDEAARKLESIGYRWRNLLAEMTIRRDRICGNTGSHRILSKWWEPQVVLQDWIQRATEAIQSTVFISDETALRNSLSNLKSLEHEIIGKKPDLERLRLSKRHLVTDDELETFKNAIEKLSYQLPEKRKFLEQKLMSLRKLSSHLDTTTSWVLEVRAQVATAKHRPSAHEKLAAIESVLIRVQDKDPEVLEVIQNYMNLEQECENLGQFMAPIMVEKIHQLKEDWLYVKSRGEINILTPAAEEKFFGYQYQKFGVGEPKLNNENTNKLSPGVPTIQVLEEVKVETLHNLGLSPLLDKSSEENIVKEIHDLEDSMTLNLKSLKQQVVLVGDVEDVQNVLEKQKNVLRELELKKPQLDELMHTAENLKSDSSRHNLHGKVSKLREHWAETNTAVVARKTQLEECLSDSVHWERQLKEVEGWLKGMESRLPQLGSSLVMGHHNHNNEFSEHQLIEQKNFQLELASYKKQIENFQELTYTLVQTYSQDDTGRLKNLQEQIMQRYNLLNNSVNPRGKVIHAYPTSTSSSSSLAGASSTTTLDRQLDSQLSWMVNLEMALGGIENDVGRIGPGVRDSPATRNLLQRVKELQSELESHSNTVAALSNAAAAARPVNGAAASASHQEDTNVLLYRLDEMNQRWHSLKQRSMAIRSRLESNTEHWHALLLSLREIIEWVIRKDTELTSLGPIGGDVYTLQKQIDDHRAFRRELDAKRPIVETNLISGRQHVANEPPVSDLSDNESSKELDGDARGYRSAEAAARELTRSIRREVTKLSETWLGLLSRSDNLQLRLEETIQRLRSFQQMLDDGSARLATAEAIKSRWSTIAAAADKSTLLDQLKTFREHISSTTRAVNDINDHAGHLTASSILLSSSNILRIDELNSRLKNLQLSVEEREQELIRKGEAPAGSVGVPSIIAVIPPNTNSSVEPPWERAITPTKVPYYINHQTETTQWDHPKMSDLLNSLAMFNDVRFSAYRTALKLRAVQKEIRIDKLPLKTVVETFDSLGLRGHNDRLLDVPDMTSTLNTLYQTCMNSPNPPTGTLGKGSTILPEPPMNIPFLTDLAVNWLLNVYDSQRTGQLRNLSFKIGVVLLCKGPMEDKFRYLFRLVADVSKQVDQRKLGLLLHDCMQIPRQLGEVAAFGGSNIEPSVRSCFEKAGKDKTTIEAQHFLEWVKQEPQSLVWLPVLHRIAAAEYAKHQAKCNVCKQVPIIGLRYRCLKCFNFDMCQRCFFSGKKAKNHKLTHPMQEYCVEATSGEDVRDFTRALKNRFKSKRSIQKHRKLGYLPVQMVLEGDALESPAPSPQHSLSPDIQARVESYATRLADVELRNRSNSTPDSEDEHSLIAQYCQSLTRGDGIIPRSPIQIVAAIDAEQSEQLEAVIRALEEENASLQAEYERLKHKTLQQNGATGSSGTTPSDELQSYDPTAAPPSAQNGRTFQDHPNENNILAEARLLRQHKGRLEARMQILEDHNRQLETQLQRLRQLLDEPGPPGSPNKTGTLQSKSVVAAELATDSPLPQHRTNGHSHGQAYGHGPSTMDPWHQSHHVQYSDSDSLARPPPPTPGYSVATGPQSVDVLLHHQRHETSDGENTNENNFHLRRPPGPY